MRRLRAAQILVTAALTMMLSLATNSAWGQTPRYTFQKIATLGDAAPGGDTFTSDFEPWGINSQGELAFVADLAKGGSGFGEGVFIWRNGQLSQITRSGKPAPGGGTLGAGTLGYSAINDGGDVAFGFILDPFVFPAGFNAGVYRFSHATQTLTAVMTPFLTPAPGGGFFQGSGIHTSLNNRGDIAFPGMVNTAGAGPSGSNLALGVFMADKKGQISRVAAPGDPAPGGGRFDFVQNPWNNDSGDIAFGAHVAGEECIAPFINPPIFCAESVYLKDAATGAIHSIAHQGDPAPGGGHYRLAFGPVMNNRNDILFVGDLTPAPGFFDAFGLFLNSGGNTTAIARPGDAMPGGGKVVTANNNSIGNYSLNNRGEVSFNALLDTGPGDTGLYVRSQGLLQLVARTGTAISGVGTVDKVFESNIHGAALNERGQVFFWAVLKDGSGVLLLATPNP